MHILKEKKYTFNCLRCWFWRVRVFFNTDLRFIDSFMITFLVWCIKRRSRLFKYLPSFVGFSKYFGQDMFYKDENWHASPHEQYLLTHCFLDIFLWVFNDISAGILPWFWDSLSEKRKKSQPKHSNLLVTCSISYAQLFYFLRQSFHFSGFIPVSIYFFDYRNTRKSEI